MNDKEQRDDDTDCHSNFNAPADCQGEGEEHQCEVDPGSHPVDKQMRSVRDTIEK